MTFEEGMKLLENVPRRGALLIDIVCFLGQVCLRDSEKQWADVRS